MAEEVLNKAHQCPGSRLRKPFYSQPVGRGADVRLTFLLPVTAGYLIILHVLTKLEGDSSPSGTDLPDSSGFLLPGEGGFGSANCAF